MIEKRFQKLSFDCFDKRLIGKYIDEQRVYKISCSKSFKNNVGNFIESPTKRNRVCEMSIARLFGVFLDSGLWRLPIERYVVVNSRDPVETAAHNPCYTLSIQTFIISIIRVSFNIKLVQYFSKVKINFCGFEVKSSF